MALIDSVVYWDKNEDNANLITPDIGAFVGTPVGSISFEVVKYLNGAIVDNTTSGLYYGRANISPNPSRYVIEFWVKWKVSSAVWSVVEFFCGDRQFLTYHGISFRLNANKTWRVQIKDGAGDNNYDSAPISFAQDQVDHVVLVIDSAASFDGAKTFSVRRNGVEELSGTRAMNFVTLDPSYGFYASIIGGGASFIVGATNIAFDNPKVYDSTGIAKLSDIEDNKNNEGFPTPTFTISIPTVTLPTYTEKIIIDNDTGWDIFQQGRVKQFPNFKYKKTFDKKLSIVNTLSIPVINNDNYFTPGNDRSAFTGIQYKGMPIELIDKFGIKVWEGYIQDIPVDLNTRQATLKCKSKFYNYRKLFVTHASAGFENPMDIFQDIIDTYSVPGMNANSIARSRAYLDTNSVTMDFTSTQETQMKLIAALEEIAKYANASFYFYNGEIYVQTWQPNANLAVDIEVLESDLLTLPTIITPDRNFFNDYSIGYNGDGGTPAQDENLGDIGSKSRSRYQSNPVEIGQSDEIEFENITSAQFIGEQTIRMNHTNLSSDPKPLKKIAFKLNLTEYRRFIELSSFFKMTLSDVNWTDKIFEVFELDINYAADTLGIVAYENAV